MEQHSKASTWHLHGMMKGRDIVYLILLLCLLTNNTDSIDV